jgi:hypothetical protein
MHCLSLTNNLPFDDIGALQSGGTAIAFRQATNWASRQGFTEFVRARFKVSISHSLSRIRIHTHGHMHHHYHLTTDHHPTSL